jgi:hypothetical protein
MVLTAACPGLDFLRGTLGKGSRRDRTGGGVQGHSEGCTGWRPSVDTPESDCHQNPKCCADSPRGSGSALSSLGRRQGVVMH